MDIPATRNTFPQGLGLSVKALLCGAVPDRRTLRQLKLPLGSRRIAFRVHRTLPFEFVAGVLDPFLSLWDARHEILGYSEYDAALTNLQVVGDEDAQVFWLDWRAYRDRLSPKEAVTWAMERIQIIRGRTDAPILINNWPSGGDPAEALFSPQAGLNRWAEELNQTLREEIANVPGCAIIDLARLASEEGATFFDARNEAMSAQPFSDRGNLLIARHLAVHLLPALFRSNIKAIALDLDDTLYSGVLGEDGPEGVELTEGHAAFQRVLRRLADSGVLLTLCSRNERADVEVLFSKRNDFPLRLEDFAAIEINWDGKANNISRLAQALSIHPSAFLFVDDNPAELAQVLEARPEIQVLPADPTGRETAIRLCHTPGLYRLWPDDAATWRTTDIRANQQREKLRQATPDKTSYLAGLNIVVRVYENHWEHRHRLHELSQKTNQFNTALARMSAVEAERVMGEAYLTLTVGLSDVLSDSGVVGALVCRVEGGRAILEEFLLSCRALGREVETVALRELLGRLRERNVTVLDIRSGEGPRNQPALKWLNEIADGKPLEELSVAELLRRVEARCREYPITVEHVEEKRMKKQNAPR